jgi:hypothetical protein
VLLVLNRSIWSLLRVAFEIVFTQHGVSTHPRSETMNLYPKNERGRRMSRRMVLDSLGLKEVPAAGILSTFIQGIMVWAEPLRGEKPAYGKRHTHRMMAQCPACNKQMSLGRLHQHAKVHVADEDAAVAAEERRIEDGQARWSETGSTRY